MRHIVDHFEASDAPDRALLREIFELSREDQESLRPLLEETLCYRNNPFLEVILPKATGVDLVYVNKFLDLKAFVERNAGLLPDPMQEEAQLEYEDMDEGQRLRRWMNAYLSDAPQSDYRKRRHLQAFCRGRRSRAQKAADADAFEKYKEARLEEARANPSSPEGMELSIKAGMAELLEKGLVSLEGFDMVLRAKGLSKIQSAARSALEESLKVCFDALKEEAAFFDVASCVDRRLFVRILSFSDLAMERLNLAAEKFRGIQKELLSSSDYRYSLARSGLGNKLVSLDSEHFALFERLFSHEARTHRHRLAKDFILESLRSARAEKRVAADLATRR